MSLRGVRQCRRILIRYSDIDGSSKGVREWMRSSIIDFAKVNPDVEVETELKRATHPFARAYYANGNDKTIGLKNLSVDEIDSYVFDLRSQIGRKTSSNGYHKPVLSDTPSVQGEWHEELDLASVELHITHEYGQPGGTAVEKEA